jgi:2-polyprenyl-3-methyl-5-hydroxy-6-metoxy-1,4-benzoquinol methylase
VIKNLLKQTLNENTLNRLRRIRRRAAFHSEGLLGGGPLREQFLLRLLGRHYDAQFRRDWQLSEEEPHFFSHRIGLFKLAFGDEAIGPYAYSRGFYSAEVVREGDRLLDIGCGDGFFTKRFLSARCSKVDAVDVEPSAIHAAQRNNPAANINYYLLDAVNESFPSNEYDVIVWDGALGHFSPETTHLMLQKIVEHLAPEGIFVGSESLGHEGTDHLQFFDSLEALRAIFSTHFRHIELRSMDYRTGDFVRSEAFWRCAQTRDRLESNHWHT